jgi:two-component system CheB/CheR fusion protein
VTPTDSDSAERDTGTDAKLDPDVSEEQLGDEIDNIIPTRGYHMLPMVGLGGSAGSILALKSFFETMPPDTGMAFVVIIHLSTEHESSLATLLSRSTRMPVHQVEDGMKVIENTVYVIPPGKHLAAVDGHLRLTDLAKERGKRVAVDLFFRSLADTHGPHAAAIVLSGVDGDGAIGIKRVKERGGLTIAQHVEEAEHSGMPRSAIGTGMVDWVLKVTEMPGRLLEYYRRESRIEMPPEEAPPAMAGTSDNPVAHETTLNDVLTFVRARTGRDFTYYKRATILRRISRRMQVNAVDDLAGYLALLRTNPGEAGALVKDLLISVTNFFRDRDAFEGLAERIPELFTGKTQSDVVRVWVPACATGEEVYSIAMLLVEHSKKLELVPAIQVFGCDLDAEAIQVARAGLFPEAITADVSEDRLRRFFVKENDGYRVRRELREMVLFATHDLLKDPPFSRMDLVSCRNLLIYLTNEAQQRALEIFHFSLTTGGLLFLGASESVDDDSALFRVLDKKRRLYLARPVNRAGLPIGKGPGTLVRQLEERARVSHAPVLPGVSFNHGVEQPPGARVQAARDAERISWSEIHYRLIERFAPPSVIVNADYDILHLSEGAGKFLQLTGGEPTPNLLRLVHPMLRLELRTLLFRAAQTGQVAETRSVPYEVNGERAEADLRVSAASEVAPGYLLVVFEKRPATNGTPAPAPSAPEPVVQHLERELEQLKGHLRNTIDQYEESTEELKASNEELQAMNEELRSATEELETSREELQSINEELTTVNSELRSNVDELAHANSDLQNLMASTAIATVFLDRDLRIKRFTPSAVEIFHLIPSDLGRPLSDLGHQLDYSDLRGDAERVLATLVPVEREVHEAGGRSFLARLLPYRTTEDRIAGVVLNFFDITERRRAEEALRASEERMRLLIESAKDYAIFTTDTQRRVDSWNTGAEAMFGYSEKEIIGQSADILFIPEDVAKGDAEGEVQRARDNGRAANERWHIRKDRSLFYGSGSVMPVRDHAGKLRGFVKIMRDLTTSKQAESALREHMDELTRFNRATEGRELRMIELKKEINELCARLGESLRYPLDFAADRPPTGAP